MELEGGQQADDTMRHGSGRCEKSFMFRLVVGQRVGSAADAPQFPLVRKISKQCATGPGVFDVGGTDDTAFPRQVNDLFGPRFRARSMIFSVCMPLTPR